MAPDRSFDELMRRLRAGDAAAAAQVFECFAQRLVGLARGRLGRLGRQVRRTIDPEDVLQSVFRSFFARQAAGQFQFDGWESLWGMLVLLTVRKCGRKARHLQAARRDLRRDAAGADDLEKPLEWEGLAREPSPAEAAALTDLVEELLRRSPESERPILLLSLEGYSQLEISDRVGCTERTVRRVLTRVRDRLQRLQADNHE
ncbi:MAG: sigma-70 family RNA polymerase sigma factor [Gemmataceae bacterium]|nr:sigma-70 family RNA polymerase sigma factor [Gemmataceae bacterium]